jgi:hypothetical protein
MSSSSTVASRASTSASTSCLWSRLHKSFVYCYLLLCSAFFDIVLFVLLLLLLDRYVIYLIGN